jgi:predicted DNA-binding transcriptional regulator YafY
VSRTQRIYRIAQLLGERKIVSRNALLDDLEISHATLKRDLEYMRERLNAPIEWDRNTGGYRFGADRAGQRYQLPGLWFSPAEIIALLTMRHLIDALGPGLISEQIEPLLSKMRLLVEGENVSVEAFEQRIRIRRSAAHVCESEHFTPVATAVLRRKQLEIVHYSRSRDETVSRRISPQRLTHYRENWYVDAWCHLRGELRKFSLSAIRQVRICDSGAEEVPEEELSDKLDSGYGIFSGKEQEWAELVFTSSRARWISQELWHRDQQSWFDAEGRLHLRFPYSDPREVCMDILRHVPEVSVVSPASLRSRVLTLLSDALQKI